MNIFEKLCRRSGGFSLPFLIHIYDSENHIEKYFINKTDSNVLFGGHTYLKSKFNYTPKTSVQGFDGGGKLEITADADQMIELAETYSDIHLEVIACMNEDGTFTELKSFSHHYGTISGNRNTIVFDFEKDDRLDMTFPTLIWSTHNNKGNS